MHSPRVTFSTKEITNLTELTSPRVDTLNPPRVDTLNPGETNNYSLRTAN
jgi:hypothetical protein